MADPVATPVAVPAAAANTAPTPPPLPPGATSADYQAAALEMLSKLPDAPAEGEAGGPQDGSPQVAVTPAAPVEPVAVAPIPPAAPEVAAKAPEEDLKGFDALVREKAMLRRREEALKAREAQFDPIAKALDSDDPLAYLQASGKFTYEQLAKQLIEGKKPGPPEAKKPDPVMAEVQQLRQMLMQERANTQRAQAYANVVETVRSDPEKYKFVAGKKMEAQVLQNLEAYVNDTGTLPAEDMATSIRMAVEAVEMNLRKEAQSWAALLTPQKAASSVASSSENAVPRPQGITASQPAPTLTNAQASVPSKPAVPKTKEEYQALALALFNAENS